MRVSRETEVYTEGEETVRENLLGHRERGEKQSEEISIVHENTCTSWKAVVMEREKSKNINTTCYYVLVEIDIVFTQLQNSRHLLSSAL